MGHGTESPQNNCIQKYNSIPPIQLLDMAPNADLERQRSGGGGSTVVVRPTLHGDARSSYVCCNSSGPFVMPPADGDLVHNAKRAHQGDGPCRAEQANAALNLNLGLPLIDADSPRLRWLCRFLNDILLPPRLEALLFRLWSAIPLRFKQILTRGGWAIYLPLHRILLGRRTGLHPDASPEYHSLTTLLWWGRLFPVTVERMRFSLGQLGVWHPPEAHPPLRGPSSPSADGSAAFFKQIRHDMTSVRKLSGTASGGTAISEAVDDPIVTGVYIRQGGGGSGVLLWLYGGAYLAGDVDGNLPLATKFGRHCRNSDVFVPSYRLIPEHTFFDAFHDVVQAYEYLVSVRGVSPGDITVVGISSGGGLAVRLLQYLAERRGRLGIDSDGERGGRRDEGERDGEGGLVGLLANPAGAVLLSPFVDYTEPKGSFKHYVKHDLIVNQSVFEEGIPYLADLGDSTVRKNESPVFRSFAGLPPLCVLMSEHECCYDQCTELVNRARADGVRVTVGAWRYLCHVFQLLGMFIPEGREAMDFVIDWVRENTAKGRSSACTSCS